MLNLIPKKAPLLLKYRDNFNRFSSVFLGFLDVFWYLRRISHLRSSVPFCFES